MNNAEIKPLWPIHRSFVHTFHVRRKLCSASSPAASCELAEPTVDAKVEAALSAEAPSVSL